MKAKNWFFGAAGAAILVGSLIGVGCKSNSSSNANATKTAQAKATPKTTTSSTPKAASTKAAGTGTPAAMTTAAVTPSAGTPTVKTSNNPNAGLILTDAAGRTLYKFKNDQPNVSNCAGACASLWPALTTSGAPTADAGVIGQLATIQRSDGSTQVTYNGSPLYRFANDTAAGDTKGDGFAGLWSVVKVGG